MSYITNIELFFCSVGLSLLLDPSWILRHKPLQPRQVLADAKKLKSGKEPKEKPPKTERAVDGTGGTGAPKKPKVKAKAKAKEAAK